ncbi:alpha-galactosidase [Kamptonema cortianum]|nr:glycoside hydrolase family 36 protein [Oscillatoria laete-virens]MDK3159940.1 alpha-galactosidase [Kamptonema cortianum]MDL5047163.1 alpha-galactosidase [Oscillatoria amoena NRMC-F 0135]MDL5055504.1 alpha-galactosidase [Oscillatoria laete-virens NRMC-F 0139]
MAQNWFDIIRENLNLNWIERNDAVCPFSVTVCERAPWVFGKPAGQWSKARVKREGKGRYLLTSRSDSGLEGRLNAVFHPDTNAVELFGEMWNQGDREIREITGLSTLDTTFQWARSYGEPLVRTFNGARFIPSSFPVHDFRPVDHQCESMECSWTPIEVSDDGYGRSSGKNLPCVILSDRKRQRGLVFFLEWSGSWQMSFLHGARGRQDQSQKPVATTVRASMAGLHCHLKRGEMMPLPRLLMISYEGGLEEGSNALRRHIRRHVTPSLNGQEMLPPTSYNHWFAFGNDFTAASLKPAVDASAEAGLEYFCVDAAWFAGDFRSGIGNWNRVDKVKFPEGVEAFADYVRKKGMKYGTWFEPEWAHRKSDLVKKHPDWFLPTPAHYGPLNRHVFFDEDFLLMDFGLREVQSWWVQRIVEAYERWHVRWIRWDFNQMPRPNWEAGESVGSLGRQQIAHVQGLYQTLDEILRLCPDLLIEQCASGGYRIDLGTVRRGHTFWMNDHTMHTPTIRSMQMGLNHVLPGNYGNTNLCQFVHDYHDDDFYSHGMGGFGYSGKLWEAPKKDFHRYREAVSRFKAYRHLLLGDFSCEPGVPGTIQTPATVRFADGREHIKIGFNVGGKPGKVSVSCRVKGLTQQGKLQ